MVAINVADLQVSTSGSPLPFPDRVRLVPVFGFDPSEHTNDRTSGDERLIHKFLCEILYYKLNESQPILWKGRSAQQVAHPHQRTVFVS